MNVASSSHCSNGEAEMSMRIRLSTIVVVLAAMALPCWSQNASTGAITGVVLDSSGAVVPNARVSVINNATGDNRTTTSKANGSFSAQLLPPGKYRVEVNAQGFKAWIAENI